MELQRTIRYALSLALTAVFLLHVANYLRIPLLTSLENNAYDLRLALTLPKKAHKKDVVIIDIDEKSLGELGQWPWSRSTLARITDILFDDYAIEQLGFDIVFAEPDVDDGARLLENMAKESLRDDSHFLQVYQQLLPRLKHDEQFSHSLKNRKTVLGFVLDTDTRKGSLPPPVASFDASMQGRIPIHEARGYTANLKILQDSAMRGGFFDNPLLDSDGVFRRVPMLQEYQGKLYESLSLAMARIHLGSPPIQLIVKADDSSKELFLEELQIGDNKIPVDQEAGMLVPYLGRQHSFDYIPATDVLNKRVEKNRLQGKIALFGTSAPGLLDLRTTPLEAAYPGVEVHANIIQGILDQRIMHKPGYTQGLEFIMLSLIGLLITFLLPLLSAIWSTVAVLALITLIVGGNLLAWNQIHMVLPIASPILLVVLLFTLQMTYSFFVESRGKRQLTQLFGKYVPPELVEEMSEKMEDINLDGEMREMSVLFSDVRGFTTISEGLEPKELTAYINAFLTPITQVIHDNRGTIDKYMGDAVMAFWGAPLEDDQHALHALTAAIGIVERMKTLRKEFSEKQWPAIYVGVGVNTGMMNVGNKGSEFRVDYTILGDAVNLGSRLEGLTKVYGVDIITSEFTKHAVPEFAYRELDRVRVKGKDKPVTIYEPLGLLENVSREERRLLKQFHIGIKYFRAQQWDAAEREIFALSRLEPERKIYQIYLERIMFYRENPPGKDWDGSFTHTTK